jgi:hypothetical protein
LSAEDALRLRPLMQPVLERELARHPEYAPRLAGAYACRNELALVQVPPRGLWAGPGR